MTSNGTENQTTYKTNDGEVFNSSTKALQYMLEESEKTSTVTAIMEFQEYYY